MSYYIIKCGGWAVAGPCPTLGQYLQWYDPNLPAGEALSGWTWEPDKAKRFSTVSEAAEEWRRQRTVDGGSRLDGQPNRPLSIFHVEIQEVR